MENTIINKQNLIKDLFSSCIDQEGRYNTIIELGRRAKPMEEKYKLEENKVHGCQSTLFLRSYLIDDRIYFQAESDALISSGLAELLTQVYSGELPETVIKSPPSYLEELGVVKSLTPNRANGLYSIHLKMKQEALKALLKDR